MQTLCADDYDLKRYSTAELETLKNQTKNTKDAALWGLQHLNNVVATHYVEDNDDLDKEDIMGCAFLTKFLAEIIETCDWLESKADYRLHNPSQLDALST